MRRDAYGSASVEPGPPAGFWGLCLYPPRSFPLGLVSMSEPIDPEFTLLLARAFDLAWEQYYGPDYAGSLSEEIARPELAKYLVEMAKSGVKEEEALAACGVLHLVALTMDRPPR